jgi:hypothetical protein
VLAFGHALIPTEIRSLQWQHVNFAKIYVPVRTRKGRVSGDPLKESESEECGVEKNLMVSRHQLD